MALHDRRNLQATPRRHALHGAGIVTAGMLACASFAASAHHSISAVYDSTRQQRIEGVVAEFQFVNPHPFVIVTVDAEGAASRGGSRWTIGSSSPTSG